MKIQFTIDGPLMGYKQTTRDSMFHPKERERSKAYGAWKEKVRVLAFAAGIPITGMSDIDHAPRLSVHVYWKTVTKIDFKNVYGAVEDAIWHLPQGDRYVRPGKYSDVTWNSGCEEAIVTVEF
jgi:hypothetical protein